MQNGEVICGQTFVFLSAAPLMTEVTSKAAKSDARAYGMPSDCWNSRPPLRAKRDLSVRLRPFGGLATRTAGPERCSEVGWTVVRESRVAARFGTGQGLVVVGIHRHRRSVEGDGMLIAVGRPDAFGSDGSDLRLDPCPAFDLQPCLPGWAADDDVVLPVVEGRDARPGASQGARG